MYLHSRLSQQMQTHQLTLQHVFRFVSGDIAACHKPLIMDTHSFQERGRGGGGGQFTCESIDAITNSNNCSTEGPRRLYNVMLMWYFAPLLLLSAALRSVALSRDCERTLCSARELNERTTRTVEHTMHSALVTLAAPGHRGSSGKMIVSFKRH